MKQSPCCARYTGRLTQEEGNLARLARRAATRTSKGLLVSEELQLEIINAKNAIAFVKQAKVDHEAEHSSDETRRMEEVAAIARTLQAEGPDEFPAGYYQHVAEDLHANGVRADKVVA